MFAVSVRVGGNNVGMSAPRPGATMAPDSTTTKYAVVILRFPTKDNPKYTKFVLAAADRGSVSPYPVFSPDSQQVLFISDDGLYLLAKQPDDGSKLTFSAPTKLCSANRISMAKFTPDGKNVVYLLRGDLYITNAVPDQGFTRKVTNMKTVDDFTFDAANGSLLFTAMVERNSGQMGNTGMPWNPGMGGNPFGNGTNNRPGLPNFNNNTGNPQ
jgi:hypothetical protein